MRGTIGEIVAAPGGADVSIDVVNESAAVATARLPRPAATSRRKKCFQYTRPP